MAEGNSNDDQQPLTHRFTWNIRNMPVNVELRGTQGLGRVMNELIPTIEQNLQQNLQQGSNAVLPIFNAAQPAGPTHSHSHGQGHSHNHTHSHSHNAPSNQVANADPNSFVINIGDNGNPYINPAGIGLDTGEEDPPQGDVPDENQNTNRGAQPGGPPSGNPTGIQLRTLLKGMEGSLPFMFLLFAKVMYNHRLGILVFIALFGTFHHSNTSLKKQISQREKQKWTETAGCLVWIVGFLCANIFFIYYVFEDQQLYRSLYLQLPAIDTVDFWSLLWAVGVTDFMLKFAAIVIKACVALLPRSILLFKKRGKYYMLTEHVIQFYRSLVPITLWVYFLQNDQHGGQWFSIFLLVLYALCKGQHLWHRAKELKKAFQKFKVDVSYGTCPSREEIKEVDNSCPICQDNLSDPVKLTCKHIFCEDCVSLWFDRERTCPMCRATIVDNPIWRDGSTCSNLQLY